MHHLPLGGSKALPQGYWHPLPPLTPVQARLYLPKGERLDPREKLDLVLGQKERKEFDTRREPPCCLQQKWVLTLCLSPYLPLPKDLKSLLSSLSPIFLICKMGEIIPNPAFPPYSLPKTTKRINGYACSSKSVTIICRDGLQTTKTGNHIKTKISDLNEVRRVTPDPHSSHRHNGLASPNTTLPTSPCCQPKASPP
jgi:hypothetical protein